jgi:hypothetical protein
MNRSFIHLILFLFLSFSLISLAQTDSVYYQSGIGSVASGAVQSTDNFSDEPIIPYSDSYKVMPFLEDPNSEPMLAPRDGSETLPPYVYVDDSNASNRMNSGSGNQTVLLQKFPGPEEGNSIPPDLTIAVGPNHVVACVNSWFQIWDKDGNLLKIISAEQWWEPVWPNLCCDGQVIYDHYSGRWFMMYLQVDDPTLTAGDMIAYSDDDDPLGTWYIYRLDQTKNGTQSTNTFGDYPQVGFDEECIYIGTRAFGFAGGLNYNKVRIITKSDLYTNTTQGFSYRDIWNISLPGTQAIKPDGIHPTYSYTQGEGGYLFWANRSGGNYYAVYRILNPTSDTPWLRGDTLQVQFYANTPNANQLGGGTPRIEANGSHVKTAPVVRDGKMYVSHSIGNSTSPGYASAKYLIYDLSSNSIIEQAELGAATYFYIYPTITVDKDHNIAVTYSRSADSEYIGGYYSTKFAGDPPGLSPSQPLAEGQGNYVKDFGSGRNRWGDYLGIFLDPANEYDVWIFPEYAAATNTYGSYIGQIRMVPFSGSYSYLSTDQIAFGDVEVNSVSDTVEVVFANYGTDNLDITGITSVAGPFSSFPQQTLPVTLETYDSLTVKVIFSPTELGEFEDSLVVTSSDPNLSNIQLSGNSYEIIQPYTGFFYASSGGGNNGDMLTIDPDSGNGTLLGPSLYGEIKSLAINQSTNAMYGLVSGGSVTEIVRVNAEAGDCYTLVTVDLAGLTGIDIDTSGTMYACQQLGNIYTIDLTNGDYTLVTTSTVDLNSIVFNPTTNEMWGAMRKTFGNPKDSMYTINLQTGEATPVGRTGFTQMTNDMSFDGDGNLYGVTSLPNQEGQFFQIDQTSGAGTLIGSGVGYNHTTGLAYSINGPVVSVDQVNTTIPKNYALAQNYPNPFNPTTKIEYSLPITADVQLIIYNILGQQVASLINEQKSAGNHSIQWNADGSNGVKLSSGVYMYKLKATGIDGSEFQQIRKMVLLK